MTWIKNITHTISTANSTTALLGAGATFTGAWEEVTDYTTLAVAVIGSLDTTGTIYIEVSQDGGTVVNSVPFSVTDATFDIPRIWNIVESFARIKYVNGATPQTGTFQLQTKYSNGQQLGVLGVAKDAIRPDSTIQLTKSISTGADPNGTYVNAAVGGYVDAATTQTLLGIGGIFDSGCIYVNGYSHLSLELLSDVDGFFSGTWYTDEACTDPTRTLEFPYQASNGFVPIASGAFGDYLKITYTNGGVAQTDFHLGVKFLTSPVSGFVLGLDTPITPNAVANLQRVVNSPDLDRNRDRIIGQRAERKFGYNENVANTAFEIIWAGAYIDGLLNYPFPTTAETVRVKAGGNVNDTSTGTGARTVVIFGLDENWEEVQESLTLLGASASATTANLFYRINRVQTETVGTYGGTNTGDIIIENTTALQALAYVPAGLGNTQQCVYTVPVGKTAYINIVKPSVGLGNSADIRLFHIDTVDDFVAPFSSTKHFEWGVEDYSGADSFEMKTLLKFNEKSDIFADAKRITGGGTARVSFDFEFILVDN